MCTTDDIGSSVTPAGIRYWPSVTGCLSLRVAPGITVRMRSVSFTTASR